MSRPNAAPMWVEGLDAVRRACASVGEQVDQLSPAATPLETGRVLLAVISDAWQLHERAVDAYTALDRALMDGQGSGSDGG